MAQEILEAKRQKVGLEDRDILMRVAETSMGTKAVSVHRKFLADIAFRAVKAVVQRREAGWYVDDDDIQVVKKPGGDATDTELVEGILLDKERVHAGMPARVEHAHIALLNAALEVKKTEVGAEIRIRDPAQMQAFLREEENILRGYVDAIAGSGANVVLCQKGIDDLAQHFLAKEGIYAVRRAKESDLKKLAKATGARIVSDIRELAPADLGAAREVYERRVGEDKMTFVTGCKNPHAVSILLRGGTEHAVDEMERSLEDAISVVALAVEDGDYVYGGGAIQMELALGLREKAASVGGREQLAIEAFANALEAIPRALAENAGMDSTDALIALRRGHNEGKTDVGVDPFQMKTADMRRLGVVEPARIPKQTIASATDAAVMVLRIDDVIAAKAPKPAEKGMGPEGMPPSGEFE
jgi:chaperonin GroEL (HSP60 family)